MKPLFMILSALAMNPSASLAKTTTWKIGTTQLQTTENEKTGWVVNLDCNEKILKDKSCKAFEAARSASMKKISREDRRGGKNPASVMCKIVLGGKVFIAKDTKGNQNSFCLFEDRSFISNDSLLRAAYSNDQK